MDLAGRGDQPLGRGEVARAALVDRGLALRPVLDQRAAGVAEVGCVGERDGAWPPAVQRVEQVGDGGLRVGVHEDVVADCKGEDRRSRSLVCTSTSRIGRFYPARAG
jgi:hypothetical protein